jgi:AcrR family transcriptional regulator
MGNTRTKRHVRTRQAILDAARAIIAEQGPAALSMRALAERIDYSAAGLYEYFSSKEEILTAVCDEGQRQLYVAMDAVDAHLAPVDYLQQIGLAYIRFGLEHPDYFLLMFTFEPPHAGADAPEAAIIQALRAEGSPYRILEQAIQRGIDAGTFIVRDGFGLDEMAYAAWALVHGSAMLRITALRHYPVNLDAMDEQVFLNFVRGLAGP